MRRAAAARQDLSGHTHRCHRMTARVFTRRQSPGRHTPYCLMYLPAKKGVTSDICLENRTRGGSQSRTRRRPLSRCRLGPLRGLQRRAWPRARRRRDRGAVGRHVARFMRRPRRLGRLRRPVSGQITQNGFLPQSCGGRLELSTGVKVRLMASPRRRAASPTRAPVNAANRPNRSKSLRFPETRSKQELNRGAILSSRLSRTNSRARQEVFACRLVSTPLQN